MKTFRDIPSQAVCARCAGLFVYFRRTRARAYCAPCVPLLKNDNNRFYNTWAKVRRLESRRNAAEAEAHA